MDVLKNLPGRKKSDLSLDDIRTISGLAKVPLADLDRAAARADALAAEAVADRARLDAARPALLLTATDEQLGEHDDASAAFSRTAERATALAAALRERAEVARAELAEVERVKRYDAAAALVAALPAAVERDYYELVRLGRSIVERIARARAAAVAVNSDLPEGRAGLPDVESFRHLPGQPKRVVSARRVKLYVESNGQPIEDQARVKPRWSVDAQGRPQKDKSNPQNYPADLGFNGEYERHPQDHERRTTTEIHVRRWDFVEFESVDAVIHRGVEPFASELKIPALFDLQPPAWSFDERHSPDMVLHELARPLDPIEPPQPNPPVFHRQLFDRFEREWGPLSKLGITVQDGTADAARRRSDNRHDGYKAFESVLYFSGDADPSNFSADRLN